MYWSLKLFFQISWRVGEYARKPNAHRKVRKCTDTYVKGPVFTQAVYRPLPLLSVIELTYKCSEKINFFTPSRASRYANFLVVRIAAYALSLIGHGKMVGD